jgi:hypothetical protein
MSSLLLLLISNYSFNLYMIMQQYLSLVLPDAKCSSISTYKCASMINKFVAINIIGKEKFKIQTLSMKAIISNLNSISSFAGLRE